MFKIACFHLLCFFNVAWVAAQNRGAAISYMWSEVGFSDSGERLVQAV